MRFDRTIRFEDYIWTRRKELAFLNRHKRIAKKLERDCPLFADQLAPAPETDVDAEKALHGTGPEERAADARPRRACLALGACCIFRVSPGDACPNHGRMASMAGVGETAVLRLRG